MRLIQKQELERKKSKFIAYDYEIETKEDIKKILEELRKEHKKASHIPYAYLLSNTAGKNDDKEPSGTSAMPIYQNLERQKQTNRAIFVVRYYGGTKLGASGLTKAYRDVSNFSKNKEKNEEL